MPTQMTLPCLEEPTAAPEIWDCLDNTQRAAALDKLAQLIAKAAMAEILTEEGRDE